MFRAIDFLKTSDKKSYFYKHATVCNLSSCTKSTVFDSLKDIPLKSRAYKAETMYIFKDKIARHFSGMSGRN
jgi:hypothetical protein